MKEQRTKKILTFIGLALIILGIVCFIVGLFFEKENSKVSSVLYWIAATTQVGGLVVIVLRFIFLGFTEVPTQVHVIYNEPEKEVKTVDVKPVEETQEEKLFKQYENLYKEGLISKEDLDKKRQELLG